jgi:hypothetical protein
MKLSFKASLPILCALVLVSFLSYRIFSIYKPSSQREKKVQGANVARDVSYLASIPLPLTSKVVGETYSERSEQVTARVEKGPDYILKFYRNVLITKGWVIKTETSDSGGEITYRRGDERFTVSVLSYDSKETVFSLAYEK